MAATERELARPTAAPGTQVVRATQTHTEPGPLRLPLWLFAALAVFLLLAGAASNHNDALEYQCYAVGFWHGLQANSIPSAVKCASFLGQTSPAAFATLPREYGPLAMVVFSLPLLGPAGFYPWLLAAEMLAVVLALGVVLHRLGPFGAGHAWLLYVMLGSAATAAARFDVVPAACTLLALIALKRGHVTWGYLALAVGTLLKLYPVLLLPLFLIESWRQRRTVPLWRGPSVYAGSVALVEGLAWLLNPASVLAPLTFLQGRCTQVESLPATLSALIAAARSQPLAFNYGANSVCQISPALGALSLLCTGLAVVGVIAVVALFWRGTLSLGLAAILVLALAMLGSKVFSPQYVLWISPIVAWEFGLSNLRAFAGWCLVCLATTLCYPLSYTSLLLIALQTTPDIAVPITAGLRNALLLGLVGTAIGMAALNPRRLQGYTARTSSGSRAGG